MEVNPPVVRGPLGGGYNTCPLASSLGGVLHRSQSFRTSAWAPSNLLLPFSIPSAPAPVQVAVAVPPIQPDVVDPVGCCGDGDAYRPGNAGTLSISLVDASPGTLMR
jgi:hypothetical protein